MAITNASTSKASVSLPTSGLASAESSWGEKAMTDLETMPATVVPETEITPETEEPTSAHIVKVEPGESAAAKVLQARIEGTPLEKPWGGGGHRTGVTMKPADVFRNT